VINLWKKGLKTLVSFILVVTFIFIAVTVRVMSMPKNINVSENKANLSTLGNLNLKSNLIYRASSIGTNTTTNERLSKPSKMDVSIKLFGIIPVKKVTLNLIPEYKVIPGGHPIGVKIHTTGALVVGFADIETPNGKKQSPAVVSGVELGDCIIEINNTKIEANNDISKIINANGNKKVNVKVNRKGEIKYIEITPLETKNKNEYKIGLWVRDSTAGVGTLTFYDHPQVDLAPLVILSTILIPEHYLK
jgi:stage IV sporulation protein B